MSAERIVSLYDLADAAYDAKEIRAMSARLGHVAIIDRNPRRGEKIEFSPAEAMRYHERSAAERVNSHLHEEHGGRHVRVRLSAVPGTGRRTGQGRRPSGLRPGGHCRRADAQDACVAPPRAKGASESPVAKAGTDGVCTKTAIPDPQAPGRTDTRVDRSFSLTKPLVVTAEGGRREGFCKSLGDKN